MNTAQTPFPAGKSLEETGDFFLQRLCALEVMQSLPRQCQPPATPLSAALLAAEDKQPPSLCEDTGGDGA